MRKRAMPCERPCNILVIFTDTHTASVAGCYGSRAARTPHLDKLSTEGVLYERAYCQNPLCVPSRQSLITGKYSFQTGVIHNDQPMPELYTMGHHFGKGGYEAAALGKMHFIPDAETSLGKERHHGFAERVDYEEFWQYLREERGCPPVEGQPDDPWRIVHLEKVQHRLQGVKVTPPPGARKSPQGLWRCGTLPHEDHQEAMVLRAWKEFLSRDRQKPFLAFVSFQSPHAPFVPPAEFLEEYKEPIPLPDHPGDEMLTHPVWRSRARCAPDEARQEHLRYYYAFVSYTDWCVGEALRMLDSAGHHDDTLVVYVSDHGEMGYHHGLTGKCVFYEESVRVPLIMRMPGSIPAGWRYRGLVELLDIFPTFCEAAGLTPPDDLPGRSLCSDLLAQRDPGKEAVFSESYPMERTRRFMGDRMHRMVLTDDWKLIQYGDVCIDLFDVTRDPENTTNLSDDPRYRTVKEELIRKLEERLGPLPQPEWPKTMAVK